ncbi:MAG: 3-deoxy-D-manno-octulosonic acid transferase, partial [Fusobacteriaceae bacterium]|nr:3-deoxy-D-manno-octulosonic acid transferase [Fusobacteriaceae bacterium]
HSLLEPLYYGKKPIFGPYLQNVKDIANEILRLDLGYKVEGIEEFIRVIDENTSSPDDFKRIKDFLDRNSKSSKKSYKLIFEK